MTYAELKASLPVFIVKLILGIIKVEGGYSDDPSDSGGKTKYGITEKVARQYGYKGDMRDLPEELAFKIYLDGYYRDPGFDIVAKHSKPMAEELTDTGVNMGQGRALGYLRLVLNVVNMKGTLPLYPALTGKGKLNKSEEDALEVAVAVWGDTELEKMLNCLQGAGYVDIACRIPRNRKFCFGWFSHRVSLPKPEVCSTLPIHSDYSKLAEYSRLIAQELSDIRQTTDSKTAVKCLQRSLNAMNSDKRNQEIFVPLEDDGLLGNKTYTALSNFLRIRGMLDGGNQLVKALNCLQGEIRCSEALADTSLRAGLVEWFQTRIQMPCR